MRRRAPAVALAALLIPGCGGEPPASGPTGASPESPAASSPALPEPMPPMPLPPEPSHAGTASAEGETFAVDAERGMVRLPGRGWVSSEAFWELYHHRPEELPPDLDHGALAVLRPPESP